MNRLYETEIQVDSIKQVNAAILSVLEGREPQFENMVQFFTENQFSLLKAIAKDSIVAQPTSGKFIKEHKLSGASSVKAALKILEDKELVYRTNEGYVIYDRFMDLWLKHISLLESRASYNDYDHGVIRQSLCLGCSVGSNYG